MDARRPHGGVAVATNNEPRDEKQITTSNVDVTREGMSRIERDRLHIAQAVESALRGICIAMCRNVSNCGRHEIA
jgi:hypothetical protein